MSETLLEKEETDEFFVKMATIIVQIIIGVFVTAILLMIISLIIALLQLSIEELKIIFLMGCLSIVILMILWLVGATTTNTIDWIIETRKKSNKK